MAKVVERVQELGNFWTITSQSVEKAKQMVAQEQREAGKTPVIFMSIDERIEYNNIEAREEDRPLTLDAKMNQVAAILKKAGIGKNDFPFNFIKDKEGKVIDFSPKGKNKEEIEQNIMNYKEKIQEAFDEGKINEEEYEQLNENLEEMMEEKEIELEEDKIEIHVEEIEANLKGLVAEMYGDLEAFEKECETYDDMDLDDRKFKLGEFNSKINSRLGIQGDLKFLQNPDVKFEKSFFNKGNGGYYLTEQEVAEKGLKATLYNMMEKSMIREKEMRAGIKFSEQKRKAMHDQIIKENIARQKRAQEIEKENNRKKAAQFKRNLF